jgi:hypothetical protein
MAARPQVALPQSPGATVEVRSWLFVLCLWLATAALFTLAYSIQLFTKGYAFRAALGLGSAGFAYYCGRLLWKKNPKGAAYTRYFLYFNLGQASKIAENHAVVKGDAWLMALCQTGVAITWLLYLGKSKRVKNTYDLVRQAGNS